jgi:VanZ family protein
MLALLTATRYAKLRLYTAYALFLLILVAGSIPGARREVGQLASGLILHAGAYSTLAYLVYTGCNFSPRQCAVRAIGTVAVMGAIDELVQGLWTYRRAAFGDWLVDVSAAVVTVAVLHFLLPRLRAA